MPEAILTQFVEANGLRFEVDMCGQGDTLVLCLHGFPEHAFSWRHQMPVLADMGYKVWAPNQRGYGLTDKPARASSYTIETLAEDAGALFDASGCSKLILLGHDWGAIIAWYFAIYRVRPLDRLIIANAPHPRPFNRTMQTDKKQRRMSWYMTFFRLPWLPEAILGMNRAKRIGGVIYNSASNKSKFPPEVLDVYRDNAAQPGALRAMLNYYRAIVPWQIVDPDEETPIIDAPTLMIWGEADMAAQKQTTYGTEDYVSDLTIRYLPGISHWVQQDAPESFNAILAAWLGGEPIPTRGPDGIAINPA